MKKFELPEQPKITNTAKDFTVAKEAISNLDKFDYAWKSHSHKLERRFTAAIKYIEEIERENQRLRAENIAVKTLVGNAKKQQPEIPEVPKEVANIYEKHKAQHHKLSVILEELYVTTFTAFGSSLTQGEVDDVVVAMRTNGYTVKEKQFYLKHIDFCKRDKDYDWYMIKHSDGPLNHFCVAKGLLPLTIDTHFTQQEINSINTGSYEQIEVEE